MFKCVFWTVSKSLPQEGTVFVSSCWHVGLCAFTSSKFSTDKWTNEWTFHTVFLQVFILYLRVPWSFDLFDLILNIFLYLSVCLYVCLTACQSSLFQSVCLPIFRSVSVRLSFVISFFVHLSVSHSVCLSTWLSLNLSVDLSTYLLCRYVCMSICLWVWLPGCPPVSVCLSECLSNTLLVFSSIPLIPVKFARPLIWWRILWCIFILLWRLSCAGFRGYPFSSQYGPYPVLSPDLTSWYVPRQADLVAGWSLGWPAGWFICWQAGWCLYADQLSGF